MTDKLVLIDLSSIARPIYESLIDQSSAGTQIVAKVRALAYAHRHVAICCDSRKSFRKELDASYKANRGETPGVYLHQLGMAVETLQADGFPIWQADGFEADDVIATAVDRELKSLTDLDASVLIISADKDLLQLVSERVEQFRPANGATTEKTYDVAAVREKFGVDPHQMADYLALVGDKSDNIIGAKGIGAVGAAKLLNQFGNLDDMYAAMDTNGISVTPAIMSSLLEFRARLPLVRQLIALRTDVPIPFEQIFAERVPQDVATFGPEDDIEATMQPLETSHEDSRSIEGPTAAESKETSQHGQGVDVSRLPDSRGHEEGISRIRRGVETVGEPVRIQQDSRQQALTVLPAPVEWERELEPRNIAEAKDIAKSIFESKLFSAYGHPAGIFSTIMAGRELGFPVMASLRAFHIIENKPTMSADFVRGLVLKSGLVEYLRCTERTAERATFAIKRKGDPEFVMSFTMDEAKAAGIVKPNSGWVKWPADMLVARCSIKICRLVVPEISHGMYEPEEVR